MVGSRKSPAAIVCVTLLSTCSLTSARTIYVDDDANAPGDGSSWQTAYKFLQDALAFAESAAGPVEIRVAQGTYKPGQDEEHPQGTGLRFPFELSGDMILRGGFAGLTGHDPNARDMMTYPSVLSGDWAGNDVRVGNPRDLRNEQTLSDNSERVVQIVWPGSILLEGFVITGGYAGYRGRLIERPYGLVGGGLCVTGNRATIRDCVILGNSILPTGAATICAGYRAAVTMNNSILGWNGDEHLVAEGLQVRAEDDATLDVTHCDVEGAWPGEGNIDVDPLFADPGHWDPNSTLEDPNDDFFVEGDYHLKSQAGRWDPATQSWVNDEVTSPCIDAGDPNSPVGEEPEPNGGRINVGAYGGTAEASMSQGPPAE
jgi:hypothetical protein